MATLTQAQRPLAVTTPLGPEVLLPVGLTVSEGVSQLFTIYLDLVAENAKEVAFDKLLGQKITVTLITPKGKKRYFNGVCNVVGQGERDEVLTAYRMELVPQFWLLTKRIRSQIFQHLSVPDILKKVLDGVDVAYELQGTFEQRDFCVQYRESDFNFVSRLMEEEGIYYFFKHTDGGHKMVVANTPQSHPDLPDASKIVFESVLNTPRDEDRILSWEKAQELRAGKYTLWDHCFELPHKHLDTDKTILDSVSAGSVNHKLKVGGNDKLEIYDWPGGYAQRFDGVDRGGGDNAGDLQKIFQDNKRTIEIRMQQEASGSVVVRGTSDCRHFVSGYKFTLDRHFNANGAYLLTGVQHRASLTNYRSGSGDFEYENNFTCTPFALPFRPERTHHKPTVSGTQSAVVVGPSGEEIFTDKYGRVKVQFHWDRDGKNNADSSCWVRVATLWAGQQWGSIHIPRIGQEVVVAFEEGDPDRPIVVGSVYNAEQMPPYKLPDKKTQSGIKSRSTLKGTAENFNELRFEDKKDSEEVYFHAEKDFNRVVENNDTLKVGSDQADDGSQTIEIWKDRTETVKTGNEKVTIEKGDRTIIVQTGNDTHQIQQGNREVKIDMGNDTLTISMGNQTTSVELGSSSTEAMQSITLKVGENSITIDQTGVTISALMVSIQAQVQAQVSGPMVQVSGDAMVQVSGGIIMIG